MFLGFPTNSSGYLVYDVAQQTLKVVRDISVDKTAVVDQVNLKFYQDFKDISLQKPMFHNDYIINQPRTKQSLQIQY